MPTDPPGGRPESTAKLRPARGNFDAGQVCLNYPDLGMIAPFGGYKQSGNGREWGSQACADLLEIKAVTGHGAGNEG